MPEDTIESTLQVTPGDPKSGWCNGCARRPPYEPNETTAIRAKNVVVSYCPVCTKALSTMLQNHIVTRGL